MTLEDPKVGLDPVSEFLFDNYLLRAIKFGHVSEFHCSWAFARAWISSAGG